MPGIGRNLPSLLRFHFAGEINNHLSNDLISRPGWAMVNQRDRAEIRSLDDRECSFIFNA
jgi:hypothetical protein